MVFAHLALVWALQAPKAPPPKAPPPLHNPLIVPKEEENLSAFRLDAEVFGWNKAFTEVGAVAMEMVRDAKGAHRGETYLLVYPTRSSVPKHNVICHFITHVALPHNPVPLEAAGDYMWTIEWSYQNMWPRRPKHRRPKGGMAVTPLWAPMPPDPEPRAHASAGPEAHGTPPLAHQRSQAHEGSCQPWVGFRLQRGKEVRLHPYRPVDLRARCDLLRLTDSRNYWGTPDVAASMVRFDFNASPKNEESARFVVSALWQEGKKVRFQVQAPGGLPGGVLGTWRKVLSPWGQVAVRPAAKGPQGGRWATQGPLKLHIRAPTGWLPLARSLAADLGHPHAPFVADEALGETIVLALEPQQMPKQPVDEATPQAPQPQNGVQGAPVEEPAPAPPLGIGTPQGSPPKYLQDFKVP